MRWRGAMRITARAYARKTPLKEALWLPAARFAPCLRAIASHDADGRSAPPMAPHRCAIRHYRPPIAALFIFIDIFAAFIFP